MVPALQSALSGLAAAERRLLASSNNIANISSTGRIENGVRVSEPYVPQRVEQTSLPEGGVKTDLTATTEEPVNLYQPDHPDADQSGYVKYPNVNLEREIVDQKIATYDFKANLATIKTADKNLKSLLDIFA